MAKNGDEAAVDGDTPPVPAPPPLPAPPDAGMTRVRIRPGYFIHVFLITQYELEITQSWQEIPSSQVSEVSQIAVENQVPLEVDE